MTQSWLEEMEREMASFMLWNSLKPVVWTVVGFVGVMVLGVVW